MGEKVNCAVFGLGRLGYFHVQNLATRVKNARVVCVVDPQEERAKQIAHEFSIKDYTTKGEDVFRNASVDAVIIATPTTTHEALLKSAVQHHKHTFVEKPLTETLEEADAVVTDLKRSNVLCQVGFMRRFDPAYAEAKRRILSGDIGEPIYFKAISRDKGSPPPSFIKRSGGIFVDMSIHDYDMARYLMNAEITSVSAYGKVLMNPFMEEYRDADQALTFLTFSSGAIGDIEGSRNAHYGYDISTEVLGTEGSIYVGSLKELSLQIRTSKGNTFPMYPSFVERFNDSFLLEMNHFIECIVENKEPAVTAVDGKKALEIAIAAKTSFESKSIPAKVSVYE